MSPFSETANFIWSIAELLRDSFKRSKYQDVILPLTVLRRIDCVLAPTKPAVLETHAKYKGKLDHLGPLLSSKSGFAFYNTSPFDFERLADDSAGIVANLRAYIAGFSDNMREVLEKFEFGNTISKLDEAGLLFLIVERFKNVDLHPNRVGNLEMGYVFEDLIRRFNEALNENPGEHFTPREVVRLMVSLLLAEDVDALSHNHIIRTVYDPCCGSGGMLTIARDRIVETNPNASVHLFGQEVNPETFAVCKSDLYMKSPDGRDAENIKFGSTLSKDQHRGSRFDYLLTNPPYGKEWKMDKEPVEEEAAKGYTGRFGAGLPRISDGQLLFLQHMLGRMKPVGDGGSRVAIVMNGSPLFTGDAGGGESEIRRWILENDWLEAIVALPEQLFYNTGIATYIWVLTNRKSDPRRGKVQLINATDLWTPMRKSLGDKRREISEEQIRQITAIHQAFEDTADEDHNKVFDSTYFGYRKIIVDRPLRLNFQVCPERLKRLEADRTFDALARSAKAKDPKQKATEEEAGRKQQAEILAALASMPAALHKSRPSFERDLAVALQCAKLKLAPPFRKSIVAALSERDETAGICVDDDGNPEPDPELRDTENVPLGESVDVFFAREVEPYVSDAWVNTAVRDGKDKQVGKVGYEINFNRYFYEYQPPRDLEDIEADIRAVEKEILDMLREVAGERD